MEQLRKVFEIFAGVFFGLVLLALPVSLARNVFFVWVNTAQATIGFWVLVALLIGYVVGGVYLWRTREVAGVEVQRG